MTKFKVGDVVKTRDGRDARIICVDAKGYFPVIALLPNPTSYGGEELPRGYQIDGSLLGDGTARPTDLMPPEPKLKEVYQWRVKENGKWEVNSRLMDEDSAEDRFTGYCFEIHAGPFFVPEEE